MASSPTKLPLVLLVCFAILALSSVTARSETVPTAAPNSFVTEDFSLFPCISFVPEAMKCVIDVLKQAVAPHPSCCKAISKLYNCSSEFLKDIPSSDMILIKGVCAMWGVSIS
ncbi:unnamed protein product [Citrullus colocynthis]|uniref:Prolamin-like domain-containing protein n=1 Tax=Citrullus colocynthis TaxID=252529 RepID=A0ABP0ZA79_9ROSI